jgi:hypothetical protein
LLARSFAFLFSFLLIPDHFFGSFCFPFTSTSPSISTGHDPTQYDYFHYTQSSYPNTNTTKILAAPVWLWCAISPRALSALGRWSRGTGFLPLATSHITPLIQTEWKESDKLRTCTLTWSWYHTTISSLQSFLKLKARSVSSNYL